MQQPPALPHRNQIDRTQQIIQWNCHTATTQRLAALEVLHDFRLDVVCLNETKLNHELANLRLKIDNYTTHHRARDTDGRGGGVAILVRNQLNCHLIDQQLHDNAEALAVFVSLSSTSKPHIVATLYNPPSNATVRSSFDLSPGSVNLATSSLSLAISTPNSAALVTDERSWHAI